MSRSNRNMPFSMQSEFDSDAYDSDEFDHYGNRIHYEEDSDSDRLVIDEHSEYHDQRRQKTPPKARKDSKYQARKTIRQYVEGYESEDLETASGKQCLPVSPPLQEVRQVPGQGGENAPGSPVEVELMHLAPMHVEETADWPTPIRISNVRLGRNENFDGDRKEEMRDFNNDHYKTKDHFVWTNQLVVGRGVELVAGENWLSGGLREINNNPQLKRFPENTFRLKKVKDFGNGLFAKSFIAKGTVIGEYTGELITEEEEERRYKIYKAHKMSSYFYETKKPGLVVDAGHMGNHTRFINHSCDGDNCRVFMEIIDGVPRVWVVAMKDILQGQELFLDYGKEYFKDLECLCGGENCVEVEKERRMLKELKRGFKF